VLVLQKWRLGFRFKVTGSCTKAARNTTTKIRAEYMQFALRQISQMIVTHEEPEKYQ